MYVHTSCLCSCQYLVFFCNHLTTSQTSWNFIDDSGEFCFHEIMVTLVDYNLISRVK